MVRRLLLLTMVCIMVAPGVARSTTVIPPSFDQLVGSAESVFVAEVIAVRSVWRDTRERRVIKTMVTFRVEDVWKGSASLTTQLEFLGGTIDGVTLEVHGVPAFRVGQRDLLFVESSRRPMVSPLVGLMHGRMRVERDRATGEDRIRTFDGRAFTNPADIGAQRVPPGAGEPRAMRLADFRSAVVARLGRAR